ncbi:MAG: ribosome small subunit-dependent GTPase A [Candidatus Aegiribacteria sp.]|nr:ribosome small subunit-dependent GTPase A [Candidatus Aegiribacteria sp.]
MTGDYALAVTTGAIPLVERILPRSGVLQRTSSNGVSTQIIAANVNMVLVVTSIKWPAFSDGFLCRALAASSWKELKATIVLNKMDLCRSQDEELKNRILVTYNLERTGYSLFPVSCITGHGMDELLEHIRGMTVVMTGPSGVGKTSLVKYYNPSLEVRIGSLNPKTSKGKHTTVATRLIPLERNTAVIDTPGLRMFSIDHIPRNDLQFCFPEFRHCLGECKFRDCLHLSEPGCAVKSALDNGSISDIRYGKYVDFMNEKDS